jgi:hypothetical protein
MQVHTYPETLKSSLNSSFYDSCEINVSWIMTLQAGPRSTFNGVQS